MSGRPRVIVVGAGMAGLTAAHVLARHGINVQVIEAAGRAGGRMTSDSAYGHVIDRGAQFLSQNYPVILNLLDDLGLTHRLRRVSGYSATVRAGRPRVMRSGSALAALGTGLLSLPVWARLGWTALWHARHLRGLSLSDYSQWAAFDDESTAVWAGRAMGDEATEYLYEPMLEGFYFQTPEATSKALALVLTAFGLRRAAILTLQGGIGSLPEVLAHGLSVRFDTEVRRVAASEGGVAVETAAGILAADHVILAVPAPVASRILDAPLDAAARRLTETQYSASINLACITDAGFRLPADLERVYGVLIPRRERQAIAAIGIENNKLRGAAGDGHLINLMFPDAEARRLMDAPDAEIVAAALRSVEGLLPDLARHLAQTRIYRWPLAEPRSPVGRARDLARYRAACAVHPPPILLAGDYMSMPFTEGAAESGAWAAGRIVSGSGASA